MNPEPEHVNNRWNKNESKSSSQEMSGDVFLGTAIKIKHSLLCHVDCAEITQRKRESAHHRIAFSDVEYIP